MRTVCVVLYLNVTHNLFLSSIIGLDLEGRYWQYMSTHPAHASLPQTAYEEALEVLTWCYAGKHSAVSFSNIRDSPCTDQVLQAPLPLPIPSPFTQKECVDLLELLRNFSGLVQIVDTRNDWPLIVFPFPVSSASSNDMVRTRLIAQILLRYSM